MKTSARIAKRKGQGTIGLSLKTSLQRCSIQRRMNSWVILFKPSGVNGISFRRRQDQATLGTGYGHLRKSSEVTAMFGTSCIVCLSQQSLGGLRAGPVRNHWGVAMQSAIGAISSISSQERDPICRVIGHRSNRRCLALLVWTGRGRLNVRKSMVVCWSRRGGVMLTSTLIWG